MPLPVTVFMFTVCCLQSESLRVFNSSDQYCLLGILGHFLLVTRAKLRSLVPFHVCLGFKNLFRPD